MTRIVGRGDSVPTGQIPFTPRAKKILEASLREALHMRHNYIGTEHVLLGLTREREGIAMRVLADLGADGELVRERVLAMLSGPQAAPGEPDEPLELEATELASPPLAHEVLDELARLAAEKERLIGKDAFDEAARVRDRERRLRVAAARLVRAWQRHVSD